MEERLIKRLMKSVKCGVCGQHYSTRGVTVLSHREDTWFLSLFCPTCDTHTLVTAVVEAGSPQGDTDLTKEELVRLKQAPPVSGDELLDMHNFLKGFDGDFTGLLQN